MSMKNPIAYRETTEGLPQAEEGRDVLALRFDPSRRIVLRFELSQADEEEREALRYARRCMIREERTRGLEWDEPSMEDPTLAGSELRWFALASQGAWCRQKVAELIERANRALNELRDSPER
jgi:hypothetical protein